MTPPATDDGRTLIDELLAEQQQLTAVERFAQRHERSAIPAQARYYRDLLPATPPGPGEQYAFAVDLDACSGCKACVAACHSLNGLDEGETWRSVGVLIGESPCDGVEREKGRKGERENFASEAPVSFSPAPLPPFPLSPFPPSPAATPYLQTITASCHHCVDPACLNGCPVLAYEKDPRTGIVRHLDDQCIGCQYCILKCPYDVPQYSSKRGIVRKCDLCATRLAADEAPACAQACPSGAISIRLVSKKTVAENGSRPGERLLPGVFESSYTKPTTLYTSRKHSPADARPADTHILRLAPAHWPLIWMLLLTQISAGIFLAAWLAAVIRPDVFAANQGALAISGFAALLTGLATSVLHLGRPLGAWRAFLGLRRSWMSREIVAFGLFTLVAAGFVGAGFSPAQATLAPWLAGATALSGLLGVFCSAMIYTDTRRPFWKPALTFPKFFGTALLLGAAAAACVFGWNDSIAAAHSAAWVAMLIRTTLFVWESQTLRRTIHSPDHENIRSARVMTRLLRPLLLTRTLLFVVSTSFGLLAIFEQSPMAVAFAILSFASTFSSQVMERYLFFKAVDAPKMPGHAS